MSDSDWVLSYKDYDPEKEGRREVLCALGNGYIVSRSAPPDSLADDVHYPGTYLAGGYNRLKTQVQGREIENEDLVNLPNWLPILLKIENGDWLRPETVEYLDYRQQLDLRQGILSRVLRFRDADGHVTRWEENRFLSMHDQHLAALSLEITPENWSGAITLRVGIDGSVINWGVKRYRGLRGHHLETMDCRCGEDGILRLRSRMVQSRREIALAARAAVEVAGSHIAPARSEALTDLAHAEYDITAKQAQAIHLEKVAAYFNSQDPAVSEPLLEAVGLVRTASTFAELARDHALAWAHLWEQCDIAIVSAEDDDAQLKLRLNVFHLLQTVSLHSIDADVGVPPRGWHGEAYRGHIMWDELFVFPYLNLRIPLLTRALLRYRYRRLNEARAAARRAGFKGAMFPWQSGSNGREESQRIHLNPDSGRWIADNSWRQRHVGVAIAYNIWQYFEATDDREFLNDYGAELICEIARFWASLAERREDGRYNTKGVMGPDEFHTAYPGTDPSTEGGLNNNAYTNFMVSWVMARALDVLDLLSIDRRRQLCESLGLQDEELELWDDISRKIVIPFQDSDIISQFEGYEQLKEFDWDAYRGQYDSIQRLDRILESRGDDPNNYKVSKQADVLMILYLFSREEVEQVFDRLGYAFSPEAIFRNIRYYTRRTSHGSSLSWITDAWILARADRQRSWQLALKALDTDIADIQGGTTPEGIHIGAMAGTVDLIQRCYTGIETRAGVLIFNPRLPQELQKLNARVRYRGQVLDLEITQEVMTISSRVMTAGPITIAYRGRSRKISPGQTFKFRLIAEVKPDRMEREHEQERVRSERVKREIYAEST